MWEQLLYGRRDNLQYERQYLHPQLWALAEICQPYEQCCESIGKCCNATTQTGGVSDCENVVTCGPGEILTEAGCCFEQFACGGPAPHGIAKAKTCCPFDSYCDDCAGECRPLP